MLNAINIYDDVNYAHVAPSLEAKLLLLITARGLHFKALRLCMGTALVVRCSNSIYV